MAGTFRHFVYIYTVTYFCENDVCGMGTARCVVMWRIGLPIVGSVFLRVPF